jgi:hypothetical protein
LSPFVVVILLGRRSAVVADEQYRLVVFERGDNAAAFSLPFIEIGFDEARIESFGDGELAMVLDRNDAPLPLTFEIEVAPGLNSAEQRDAAAIFGQRLASQWWRGFCVGNPN